ncbi:MAG: hypothetical protein AB7O71_10735 [Hyphomicrobiaceae bacterium]
MQEISQGQVTARENAGHADDDGEDCGADAQRVADARTEAERQLREENEGQKPHGNAINARMKDILCRQELARENPDITQEEWDSYFAVERFKREIARTKKAKARGRETKSLRFGEIRQSNGKRHRLTKYEMAALRRSRDELPDGAQMKAPSVARMTQEHRTMETIRGFAALHDEYAFSELLKRLRSEREREALARLIRCPEWKQEAARIVEGALMGTLKKEDSAVATVKRLTRRDGAAGDRTVSNELASIARRIAKLEHEVRERGQDDASDDVGLAVSLLEDAIRKLRGE